MKHRVEVHVSSVSRALDPRSRWYDGSEPSIQGRASRTLCRNLVALPLKRRREADVALGSNKPHLVKATWRYRHDRPIEVGESNFKSFPVVESSKVTVVRLVEQSGPFEYPWGSAAGLSLVVLLGLALVVSAALTVFGPSST